MSLYDSIKYSHPFSRKEVFEALRGSVNVTEREISYWTDLEVVTPDIANPRSQGKTRFYSLLNVLDFAVVKTLSEAGLKLEFIKKVMNYLRNEGPVGRKTRDFFYNGEYSVRLIILDQNTDHMEVEIEEKKLPQSYTIGRDVIIGRGGNIREELTESFDKIPLTVAEPFDTLFVLNVTPLVRKIVTE